MLTYTAAAAVCAAALAPPVERGVDAGLIIHFVIPLFFLTHDEVAYKACTLAAIYVVAMALVVPKRRRLITAASYFIADAAYASWSTTYNGSLWVEDVVPLAFSAFLVFVCGTS